MIKIEKFKEIVHVRSYHPDVDMEDVGT